MPSKQMKWKKMSKDSARMMFVTGEQLERTARELQAEVEAMPDARTPIPSSSRAWGYAFTAIILRLLAAEYLLKGLSVRAAGEFKKIHDLVKLFKALDQDTQAEISEQEKKRGIAICAFLKERRNDFVNWRHPVEGISSTASTDTLDKTLAALVAVCPSGSP